MNTLAETASYSEYKLTQPPPFNHILDHILTIFWIIFWTYFGSHLTKIWTIFWTIFLPYFGSYWPYFGHILNIFRPCFWPYFDHNLTIFWTIFWPYFEHILDQFWPYSSIQKSNRGQVICHIMSTWHYQIWSYNRFGDAFLVRISAIMLDCFHDLLRLFISYMDGCENVDELVKGKRGHLSKEPASALKFKTCHFHSD